MENHFDDVFTTKDVVSILKEFSPNTKETTLSNRARSYIRYLKDKEKIKVTKQGRSKICRFVESQNEGEAK
jgi:translation initiation factor IF-3